MPDPFDSWLTRDEDDREEPCSGDDYECRCLAHRRWWADVLADRRYQDQKDDA